MTEPSPLRRAFSLGLRPARPASATVSSPHDRPATAPAMTAHLVEAAIAILGPAAIWTSQARSERVRKWASIIGLAAQPFFAASLWDSPQWGLQVVAIVSALGWVWGFWTNWIRPKPVP